jgi:hypothetical protein
MACSYSLLDFNMVVLGWDPDPALPVKGPLRVRRLQRQIYIEQRKGNLWDCLRNFMGWPFQFSPAGKELLINRKAF